MNTTIALFLIVLLVLCIGGPLAAWLRSSAPMPFASRMATWWRAGWSAGAIRCATSSGWRSRRKGRSGPATWAPSSSRPGTPAPAEYIFSVDNIRFRRAPKAELEASIETLRRQLTDTGIASEYRG